jgi:hypothetical protein
MVKVNAGLIVYARAGEQANWLCGQLREEPKVPHSKQLPAQQHNPICGV